MGGFILDYQVTLNAITSIFMREVEWALRHTHRTGKSNGIMEAGTGVTGHVQGMPTATRSEKIPLSQSFVGFDLLASWF